MCLAVTKLMRHSRHTSSHTDNFGCVNSFFKYTINTFTLTEQYGNWPTDKFKIRNSTSVQNYLSREKNKPLIKKFHSS